MINNLEEAKNRLKKNSAKNTVKNKRVPTGRTIQTRDEFLRSGAGKSNIKPDHPKKTDLYRRIVSIASNDDGENCIVKLSKEGRHSLPDYLEGKSRYKAFFEIEDDKGQPIKVDKIRFKLNIPDKDLTKKQVKEILYNCLYNPKTYKKLREENMKKIKQIKKV